MADGADYSPELANRYLPPCIETLGSGRVAAYDADAKRVEMHFDIGPQHCHSGDIIQGGFVTGMMDAAMAQAVMADVGWKHWIAMLEIKVSFLRPGRPGLNRAVAWIRKPGRSIVFLEGELWGADDKLVATSSSTVKLVLREE